MWIENTFSTSVSFILENIYYLSGIALFLIGIRQIMLSKEQSILRSKRESITLAVLQCEYFAREITPLNSKLTDEFSRLRLNPIKLFNDNAVHADNPFSLPDSKSDEFLKKLPAKTLNEYVELANRLEAFSTYFVSCVADTDTAYKTLGRAYCSNIDFISPILSKLKGEQNSYLHIKELHTSWRNRLALEKAETELLIAKSKEQKQFSPIGVK